MFYTFLGVLILGIERVTQMVKNYFVGWHPVSISVLVGGILGIPFGLCLPELGGFFADLSWPLLLLAGALSGIVASLPANIVHDLWGWVQKNAGLPPEIMKLLGEIAKKKK